MTLAADGIVLSTIGATIATRLIAGNDHQVLMIADSSGHLLGTKDTYGVMTPPSAVGANKLYTDMFNPVGSDLVLTVLGVWAILDLDVVAATKLGIKIDLLRTSSVGTGGDPVVFNGVNDTVAVATCFNDPTKTVLPGATPITCRHMPTGSPTPHALIKTHQFSREITHDSKGAGGSGAFLSQNDNILVGAHLPSHAGVILPPGYGLLIRQGPVASIGNIGFQIIFTTNDML